MEVSYSLFYRNIKIILSLQGILPYKIILCLLRSLTSMEPVLSSSSPVSPLVDLLPMSLGPETLTLSLKELRLC